MIAQKSVDLKDFGKIFKEDDITKAMGVSQTMIWEKYYKFHRDLIEKAGFSSDHCFRLEVEKTMLGCLGYLDPSRYSSESTTSSSSPIN